MELTNKQGDTAIRLREEFLPPDMTFHSDKGWTGFVDLSRAMALMVNATEMLPGQQEFKDILNMAWKAYAYLYNDQHSRILLEVLNSDQQLVTKVREHENGMRIIGRILKRVREQHGISSDVDASSTEVTDILVEEIGFTWMDDA